MKGAGQQRLFYAGVRMAAIEIKQFAPVVVNLPPSAEDGDDQPDGNLAPDHQQTARVLQVDRA